MYWKHNNVRVNTELLDDDEGKKLKNKNVTRFSVERTKENETIAIAT